MHLDTNFVVAKRHERTLDYPEVFQSESFDLCDEICLLIRRTHRGLHAAAATGLTLRRGSSAKNPPGGYAKFHGGEFAAAPLPRFSSCETVHSAADACSSQEASSVSRTCSPPGDASSCQRALAR